MRTALEFDIMCSNRWHKIKVTAREKSVFPRCPRQLFLSAFSRSSLFVCCLFVYFRNRWHLLVDTWPTCRWIPACGKHSHVITALSAKLRRTWGERGWGRNGISLRATRKEWIQAEWMMLYFWWGCRGNLTLITLGSESVNHDTSPHLPPFVGGRFLYCPNTLSMVFMCVVFLDVTPSQRPMNTWFLASEFEQI